jgi:hypothetical protein
MFESLFFGDIFDFVFYDGGQLSLVVDAPRDPGEDNGVSGTDEGSGRFEKMAGDLRGRISQFSDVVPKVQPHAEHLGWLHGRKKTHCAKGVFFGFDLKFSKDRPGDLPDGILFLDSIAHLFFQTIADDFHIFPPLDEKRISPIIRDLGTNENTNFLGSLRLLQNSWKQQDIVIPGKQSATRNPGF